MKKIFFALGVIVFVSFVYFTGGVSAKHTPPVKLPGETAIGKVDEVSVRESAQGKIRQITLRNAAGIQTFFVLASDATITGKDGNPMSLSWVKGNRVSVRYVIGPDGFTETIKSIQVF